MREVVFFQEEDDKEEEYGRNWGNIWQILCNIDKLISYYEIKEATTIFELAWWKQKLDEAGSDRANRNEYCIPVPGPVKETIFRST